MQASKGKEVNCKRCRRPIKGAIWYEVGRGYFCEPCLSKGAKWPM